MLPRLSRRTQPVSGCSYRQLPDDRRASALVALFNADGLGSLTIQLSPIVESLAVLRPWALVLACLCASCNASYPPLPTPTTRGIQVFYTRAMGYALVGSSYSFSAYAIRSDGAYEDVTSSATWLSSDPQIFRPSTTGVPNGVPGFYQALAVGSVDVRAQYQNAFGELHLTVTRTDRFVYPYLTISGGDPRSVGVKSPLSLSVQAGPTSSQPIPSGATVTSSDTSVATVEGTTVTGVGVGTAYLTVTYNNMIAVSGLSVLPQR